MDFWHLEALNRSRKGCPQVVLMKGFNIHQCPVTVAQKYIDDGYRISARYENGKGRTFYAVKDDTVTLALSKLVKTSLSGKELFLERIEEFSGVPTARTRFSFKIYVCFNEKLEAVHELYGEQAEHIENYIFNMKLHGDILEVLDIPERPEVS